jgi:4-hydroxy-tetrahydrodipicolinate synthase
MANTRSLDSNRIKGILSPVVTPFKTDLSPDADRLLRHCRWLDSNDVGLAIFGTNSEGNSLSVDEKIGNRCVRAL